LSRAARTELLLRGFHAYEEGDIEAVLKTLDPDIVVYAPAEVGNPGTFHGHEGFLTWAGHWNEAWGEFKQTLRDTELVGERHIVVHVDQTARGRSSGLELEQSASYVYEVRDNLAVWMSITFDPEKARQMALAREGE
jgi:ketosteroid isomerase-like protein